jgi:hypothetical protein
MERRFVAVNLNKVELAVIFTIGGKFQCWDGLPEDSTFVYGYQENGQIIAVFYHPSFEVVCPGCLIPFVEVTFI